MLGQDPADESEPEVGPHRLRDRDPVVAAGALHGLVALVDDHRHRLVVGRDDLVALGVVGVPDPVRAARQADRVGAQPVAGRLEVGRVALRVERARVGLGRLFPFGEKDEGGQRSLLGRRGRRLEHVGALSRRVLVAGAHVAELGPGEHVGPLRHSGHAGLVDQRRRLVHPLQLLEAQGAVDVPPPSVGRPRPGRLGEPLPEVPRQSLGSQAGLPVERDQGTVTSEIEIGGDCAQPEAVADIGVDETAAFDGRQPRRHRELVEIDVRRRSGVGAGRPAEDREVLREHDRDLCAPQGRSLDFGAQDPLRPGFVGRGIATEFVQQDDGVPVARKVGRWPLRRLPELGQQLVAAAAQHLDLGESQCGGEPFDLRVHDRLAKPSRRRDLAHADDGGVGEVAEGLEVVGPLRRRFGDVRACGRGPAHAEGVEHRLVLAHGVDDRRRLGAPLEADRRGRRDMGQLGRLGAGQALGRVRAHGDGPLPVGEQAGHGTVPTRPPAARSSWPRPG